MHPMLHISIAGVYCKRQFMKMHYQNMRGISSIFNSTENMKIKENIMQNSPTEETGLVNIIKQKKYIIIDNQSTKPNIGQRNYNQVN
jgi:hypothetical protein